MQALTARGIAWAGVGKNLQEVKAIHCSCVVLCARIGFGGGLIAADLMGGRRNGLQSFNLQD